MDAPTPDPSTAPPTAGSDSARPELRLPAVLRRAIEDHARRGHPHEVCGLLIGRSGEGGTEVRAVHPCRNLNTERAHDRYQLDPADQLAAEESAREAGLEVVGVYHTHPDHPALPSETDRAAAWPGWSYLIASVTAEGVRDVRSFRLIDEAFQEEPLTQENPR